MQDFSENFVLRAFQREIACFSTINTFWFIDGNVKNSKIANFKPDIFQRFVRETKNEKKHTVIYGSKVTGVSLSQQCSKPFRRPWSVLVSTPLNLPPTLSCLYHETKLFWVTGDHNCSKKLHPSWYSNSQFNKILLLNYRIDLAFNTLP